MPISSEEIRKRFALDADGEVRWKRIELPEELRWLDRVIAPLNKEAGEPVRFLTQARGGRFVRIAGIDVYESRIRSILSGRAEPERAKRAKRERSEAKPKGIVHRVRLNGVVQDAGPHGSVAEFIGWLQETGAEWPVEGGGEE